MGGPAARGMGDGGALEIRGCFRPAAAAKVALPGLTPFAARPESTVIMPVSPGRGYRSLGSIPSGTNVPAKTFARLSLAQFGKCKSESHPL